MTTYFSLLSREGAESPWAIEFGDYDRECVEFEREEMHEGYKGYPKKDLKIIKTGDSWDSIQSAVAALNAKISA